MAKAQGRALLNRESLSSPAGIFIEYLLAGLVLLTAWRLIFPGGEAPLPIFSLSWRLIQGALLFIETYPALAMSGIVAPFGLLVKEGEALPRFSPEFVSRIKQPLITAIAAAALGGAILLLLEPLAKSKEQDMVFRGELYRESAGKAREQADQGDWIEAGRFAEVCERIWPESPALEDLRNRIDMELEGFRFSRDNRREGAGEAGEAAGTFRGQNPVNILEALAFAETAYAEERYFDAHWLATLAGRLAPPGSPEKADAARMAARAWNAISSLSPGAQEREAFSLYRLKQSGYEAMSGGDWIRGYYTFRELAALSPEDPDAANFLALCEQGVLETAFFADELEMTVGDLLSSAIFSIPRLSSGGRMVLRMDSLSAYADYSYGFGLELMVIDGSGRLLSRMEAPYAKLLPKTLAGEKRVALLLQALDREDSSLRWGPRWMPGQGLPEADGPGPAEVVLDLDYEDFLLIAKIRRGLDNLLLPELFTAYRVLEPYGYIPQVFLAEILSRLAEPLLFLPLAVLILITGWRYRSRRRPRYIAIPMLAVLPLAFYGIFHIYRSAVNALSIWMALTLPLGPALAALASGALALFLILLVFLAGQRG
ncbi:MAG: hypothetical protein LBQ35_01925 [Spirochaetaceae bacterium]|jgi:hypothetical protein|nr:hypothetical protein [Spirochaetaceae bacterium]